MSAQRPRHLLLIAMFFPPSRASGVYRPLAMANYFARRGWKVTVITVTPDYFRDITGSVDESLLAQVDPRVQVERVHLPAQHLQTDVRRMSFLRAHAGRAYRARTGLLQRWLFPERYHTWIPGVVRRAAAVHRRSAVDVVVATGNPWSAFRAAWTLKRWFRIPYVMDYRDSWTLNQFTEGDAFGPQTPEGRWERRLVADASRVVLVNEPMREWHAARYPQDAAKMVVVENGYDPESLPAPEFRLPDPDRPLRFGYVGTITAQLPHAATWRGWEAARRDPELAGATAHMYGHLGFFPRDQDRIRAMMPDEDAGVRWEGAVGKAQVWDAYKGLDVILMMIPSSRYVTAGKSYECMATGKPIVAVHTPETAASDVLRGYPLWFPVERLDAESVRAALRKAAAAARTMTREDFDACLEHAYRYRREAQLAPLETELEEIVRG